MTKETGTLKELNVQPGDVVECLDNFGVSSSYTDGFTYLVGGYDNLGTPIETDENLGVFRILSRAKPKALRDMSWEEAEPIYQAWHRGGTLEYWRLDGRWFENSMVGLHPEMPYRLKPKHVPTFAHWAAMNEDIKFVTRDANGHIYGYGTKPDTNVIGQRWVERSRFRLSLNHMIGFDWGDLPWDECIIERPKDS